MSLRIYFYPPRDDTEGFLVEGANAAQAGKALLEHLFTEPRVASQRDMEEQIAKGLKVVRAGE